MTVPPPLGRAPFRRKPIADIVAAADGSAGNAHAGETGDGGARLGRSITTFQLASLGIGATVGTGIFFVFSVAVPVAGPAVIIAFLIAAITAGLTALCYAELASAIPAAGSSYTYTYATLGELAAFLVGWCLVLEYAVSSAAVSVGWSEYLNDFLQRTVGWQIPDVLTHAPNADGFGVNVPALVLIALCAALLIRGTSESARVNAIMVVIKLGVLAMFVVVALFGFATSNFTPFAPFGLAGVGAAAGMIFFSFIGLDTVSTAGEEVRNPRRTLPLALFGALITVTLIYLAVALAAVGAQPADEFDGQTAGLASILNSVTGANWASIVLGAAAIVSIFSVTLVTMFGQTRVLFAMSRDRVIPPMFSRVNPRTHTPIGNTVVVAVFVGALAGFLPLDFLANLVSMGTLVAFSVVSVAVILLRLRRPDLERGFRVPGSIRGVPVLPVLSIGACLYLISRLPVVTWQLFAVWIALALLMYFTYSRKHSALTGTANRG